MIFIYSRPMFLGEQYARWVCFCLSCLDHFPAPLLTENYSKAFLDDLDEVVRESIREGFISKGQPS